MKKILISTPIYYPNDKLHIGHAYTTVLSDYISRFKKMMGHEVFFVTGSDEHGQKIEDSAKEKNMDTYEYVTKNVESFKMLWKKLKVDYTEFIRTTDERHKEFVKDRFDELQEKGFIYKGKYEGNYCKSCEEFFTDSQLLEEQRCPSCKKETKILSEESFFLEISKFEKWIKETLLNKGILWPQHKVNELINNFIDSGLQDLSITRTSFTWGIKINGNDKHIIYVWLDALLNYISSLTFDSNKFSINDFWSKDSDAEIIQLVGKEITRFHSIYWPIILKMLDYREPKIYAHGWLLNGEGEKMSKSKGDTIDPIEYINEFGSGALRFYLISGISFGQDGNISKDLIKESVNGILVNKYSNLISRTQKMLSNSFDSVVPKIEEQTNESKELHKKINELKNEYISKMNNVDLSNSVKDLIKMLDEINGYIDITEPWKAEGNILSNTLNDLVHMVLKISILFSNILVDETKPVLNALLGKEVATIEDFDLNLEGKKISNIENLFMRIK